MSWKRVVITQWVWDEHFKINRTNLVPFGFQCLVNQRTLLSLVNELNWSNKREEDIGCWENVDAFESKYSSKAYFELLPDTRTMRLQMHDMRQNKITFFFFFLPESWWIEVLHNLGGSWRPACRCWHSQNLVLLSKLQLPCRSAPRDLVRVIHIQKILKCIGGKFSIQLLICFFLSHYDTSA